MAIPGEGGKGPTQSPAPTPESAESTPQATTPTTETGTKTPEADNKAKNAEIAKQIRDLDPNATLNPEQMQWVQKQAAEQAKQEKPAETKTATLKTEVAPVVPPKDKAEIAKIAAEKAKFESVKQQLPPELLEEFENAKTPEQMEKFSINLLNKLGERDRDRANNRYGKGPFGRMRQWFAKEGDRALGAKELKDAGGFKKNAELKRWGLIIAKMGAGATAASMALTGTPFGFSMGMKLGIQGAMELGQQFGWGDKTKGGRARREAELGVQAELSDKIKDLKALFGEGKELNEKSLQDAVAAIIGAEAKVITKQSENIIPEKSERFQRTIVSTVATVGFGMLHGVPVGVHDYDGNTPILQAADGSHKVVGHLDKSHTVVKNIFGSKFVYGDAELERVKQIRSALKGVKVTIGESLFAGSHTGFMGHATHELAAGLPAAERATLIKDAVAFGLISATEGIAAKWGVDQKGEHWKPYEMPKWADKPPAPPTPVGEPGGPVDGEPPKPPKPPVVKPVPPVDVKPPISVEPKPVPPVTTGPEGVKPPGTDTEKKPQTELDRLTELAEQKKPMDLDTALQVLRIVDKSPTAEPEGFHKDRDQYLTLDRKGQTQAIAMGFDTMQQIYHPSNASEADPVKKAAFEKIYSIIEDAKKFLDNERPIEQVTDKELELLEKFALEKPFGGNTMDADTALQALRIVTEDPATEPDKYNEAKARFYALDLDTQKSLVDDAFTNQFLRYQDLGKAPGKIRGVLTDSERFLKQTGVYAPKTTNQEVNPVPTTEEAISQEQGAPTQKLEPDAVEEPLTQGAITQPLPIEATPTQPLPAEAPTVEPKKSNVTQLPTRNPGPQVADQQDQLAA